VCLVRVCYKKFEHHATSNSNESLNSFAVSRRCNSGHPTATELCGSSYTASPRCNTTISSLYFLTTLKNWLKNVGWRDFRFSQWCSSRLKVFWDVTPQMLTTGFLQSVPSFRETFLNLLAPELFFLILAHPVYKM